MAEEEKAPGLEFKVESGESRPPLEAGGEEELAAEGRRRAEIGAEGVARTGNVPLHPAVVRLPASVLGRIGTEFTGYPGFTFTEGELNDLAELWMQTGVEMPPMVQAMVGTTAMVGGKMIGYSVWRKAGKPKLTESGEYVKEREG